MTPPPAKKTTEVSGDQKGGYLSASGSTPLLVLMMICCTLPALKNNLSKSNRMSMKFHSKLGDFSEDLDWDFPKAPNCKGCTSFFPLPEFLWRVVWRLTLDTLRRRCWWSMLCWWWAVLSWLLGLRSSQYLTSTSSQTCKRSGGWLVKVANQRALLFFMSSEVILCLNRALACSWTAFEHLPVFTEGHQTHLASTGSWQTLPYFCYERFNSFGMGCRPWRVQLKL